VVANVAHNIVKWNLKSRQQRVHVATIEILFARNWRTYDIWA